MKMPHHRSPDPPPASRLDASRTGLASQNSDIPISDNGANYCKGSSDSDSESSSQSSDSSYDPTTALMNEIDATQPTASKKPESAAEDLPTDQSHKQRVKEDSDTRTHAESGSVAFHDGSKQLPAEIWHHIFTFLPPRSLGNLMLVNKLFYNYLDPSPLFKAAYPCSLDLALPSRKRPSICKPDSIWQKSRRLFWPRMPSPMKGRSEVDMWRLACSRSCQFCNFTDDASDETPPAKEDQWHRGPGAKGVSRIFPFFVVSCGPCLAAKSLKVRRNAPLADRKLMILQEIDVLLSSTIPSVLLPGLPAVFMTAEMHVVAPQSVQGERSPIQEQLSKIYWKSQIDDIRAEFEEVKGLGSAAAEEWLKGLNARGKLVLADASRWEKWAISGGVRQMRLKDAPAQTGSPPSSPNKRDHAQRANQIKMEREQEPFFETTSEADKLALETKNSPVGSHSRPQGHQKRTIEEVAELKQRRKAEIERRAGLLDPPLTPAVLAHIPSFQAALHIIAPLDDNAWALLRPRLLAQRAKAEKRESESVATAMTSGDTAGDNGQGQTVRSGREPRQVPDEEWDEIQGPVRARISSYADEIIKDGWHEGDKVTKKTCPQFAAEVLLYVRKRFYAEVAKDAAAAVAAGREPVADPPEGPWTQKLTLENMKWVFDVKVRPYTEKYRKELFFCNGCVANYKYYGFEGVIQHYAAKHTTALSLGNVVVYWRAEWPDTPPFNPDPKLPTVQPPADRHAQPPPGTVTQSPYPATTSGFYLSSATHQTPHFAGTHAPFGYAASAPYPPSPAVYEPGAAPPASYPTSYTQQPYSTQAPYPPHTAEPLYGSSYPLHTPTFGAFAAHQPPLSHGPYPGQNGSVISAPASGNQHESRVDFMAKVARETWNSISHIDGLPGAVKLCVTIHHIAKGFETHFSESAPLDMFIYGLSNHKEMRPVRNINGLQCKPCVEGLATQGKPFSVPQLVSHFHKAHVEAQVRPLDWRTQMILLPDIHVLQGLPRVLAHNRAAYDAVADAFPWAFVENHEVGLRGFPANDPYERALVPSAPSYQPRDSYSPAYDPPQHHEEHKHGSHRLGPSPVEQASEQRPYYARDKDSDRPNLRPASEVYSRNESARLPVKRGYDDTGLHASGVSGRADKVPRVLLEERPRDVSGLPVRRPPSLTDEMSAQRGYIPSSHAHNGYLENRAPSMERWEGNRHHMNPQIPGSRLAENGFELLDTLESHLDRSQTRAGQARTTHSAIRPGENHPKDPAGHARVPEWSHPQQPPPRYPLHQDDSYLYRQPAERRYPLGQMEYDYRYRDDPSPRPVEEYELLEVRDPEQGTYYIRRPIRREIYTYRVHGDDRMQEHPSLNDDGRSRTMVPPSGADLEEYDPRFPAGDVPPQQPRYL